MGRQMGKRLLVSPAQSRKRQRARSFLQPRGSTPQKSEFLNSWARQQSSSALEVPSCHRLRRVRLQAAAFRVADNCLQAQTRFS